MTLSSQGKPPCQIVAHSCHMLTIASGKDGNAQGVWI